MTDVLFPLAGKRVLVMGAAGMVGSALVRRLSCEDCDIVAADRSVVDLSNQREARDYLDATRPDAIFVAAAKVGGILANSTFPADFLYENLTIATNVIEAAFRTRVRKLLFLGSSCIYPRLAPQPIGEEHLLSGPFEPTNEWYAIAKVAGLKLCQAYRRQHGCDFISAMPTNLYGPNDTFDLHTSHVVPALMRKVHEAKVSGASQFIVWGTGSPRREFLYVDDCADALVHMMKVYSGETHLNIGCGEDVAIGDLAHLVAEIVGFSGSIAFDTSKPDGVPQKVLSIRKMQSLGWAPRTSLRDGLALAYAWFLRYVDNS